jgi:hypothetical protein
MSFGFPPHVHCALTGDLAIFLDTQRDRYVGLRAASGMPVRLMLEGAIPFDDADPGCRRLLDQGLLVPDGATLRGSSGTPVAVPHASILETGEPRCAFSIASACETTTACIRAALNLRTRSFGSLLGRLAREKSRLSPSAGLDEQRIERIAREFAAHRPFVPGRSRCLHRSLALLYFLHRRGCDAGFVLAVQGEPFYAHCWVQNGHRILNDSGYFPSTLTPILSL